MIREEALQHMCTESRSGNVVNNQQPPFEVVSGLGYVLCSLSRAHSAVLALCKFDTGSSSLRFCAWQSCQLVDEVRFI